MKDARDKASNSPSFKLNSPTRQDIVNWVHRGYVFLQETNAMVQCSSEVSNKSRVVSHWSLFKKNND